MSGTPRSTAVSCAGTIIIALLSWYALSYMEDGAHSEPQRYPPLEHSKYDQRLDALDKDAIEDAYRDVITRLFSTWMKDSTGQPQRALNGARQARKAYIDSMNEIENRK